MGVLNCHLLVSTLPLSIGGVCVCVCVCVKEADRTLVVSPKELYLDHRKDLSSLDRAQT